jgi:hypothetical protein
VTKFLSLLGIAGYRMKLHNEEEKGKKFFEEK